VARADDPGSAGPSGKGAAQTTPAPVAPEAPPALPSGPRASRTETAPTVQEIVILPVRTMVLFPGVVLPLQVQRARSLRTIEEAMRSDQPVGLLLQLDPSQDEPSPPNLRPIGTVAAILRYVAGDDGSHLAVCQGQHRFRVLEFLPGTNLLRARVELIREPEGALAGNPALEALMATLKRQGLEAVGLMPGAPPQVAQLIEGASEPGMLADLLATFMDLPPSEKQEVLEAVELSPRLGLVATRLGHLLQVLRMSKDIQKQTEETLAKSQREYYLRQQLETIRRELGESDDPQATELAELGRKLEVAGLPEEVLEEARRELGRLRRMPSAAGEAAMIRTWLDVLIDLPWKKETEDKLDLERARRILDQDHYGLEAVKKRILEFLAVKKLNPERKGPILCLVGPPGVGKTSLGQSVARALGRQFVRISLGGVHDESEVRGHRRTYIGAMPGRIIDGLRRARSRNPVFMLDELDKLGVSLQGDPSAAMLEVLDPAQNGTFRDNYLNVPFDLSHVLFIGTANVPDEIPGPLRDRCEMIAIPGYTEEEKLAIARRYLVPRQTSENGLTRAQFKIPVGSLRRLISDWTREAGVRGLERQIGALARHAAARIAEGKAQQVEIREGDLRVILGPKRHEAEAALRTSVPGVATGLAWTPFGGDLLFIEASCTAGGGRLILTGQLGDVMRESAQAALTLIKARAESFGIEAQRIAECDVHIHVPAGAIPKDGPSAGVAMFVALASLFTGRSVRSDVAMTGEVSLRGLVLPVGGMRDKLLAAHAAGIRIVLLPERNRDDYDEVPVSARKHLKPIWLEHIDQALEVALNLPRRRRARSAARASAGKAKGRKSKARARKSSKRA
jgi:ATP-dependent Lon protease